MGEISVFSDFFYILVLEQSKVVTLKKKSDGKIFTFVPGSKIRKKRKISARPRLTDGGEREKE